MRRMEQALAAVQLGPSTAPRRVPRLHPFAAERIHEANEVVPVDIRSCRVRKYPAQSVAVVGVQGHAEWWHFLPPISRAPTTWGGIRETVVSRNRAPSLP